MCGFAGSYDYRDGERARREIAETMAERLFHRGPDSAGSYADGKAAFGFRRLSIIDLSEQGEQPMYSEDGGLVLMCNGEIFNHLELRQELEQKGHVFSSHSDVEVLVHLYEELGTAMVDRLNGQFAFALYDRGAQRLVMARDPFGICPLFWAERDGQVIFGSEVKALLEHPSVDRRVDLGGLDQVLSFPGLVSPRTMFEGVNSVRPGHLLVVDASGPRERQYWDLVYPMDGELADGRPEEDYREELEEALERSVRYRLQADVEVGFYLSGGIDSSLIAALIADATPGVRRHSFSIGFDDAQRSETRFQKLMADTVGSVHHDIVFDTGAITAGLEKMIYHCECPVKETYNTCSLALSESARQEGVTVILTGEGADELFAGYVGYRFDGAQGLGMDLEDDLEVAMEEEIRQRLWGDANVAYENRYVAQREISQALYSGPVNESLPQFDCLSQPLVDPERLRGRHPIHKRSYLDFKLRMADHLLSDHGDRMVLANSVEARYPFLDPEVVRIATRMPTHLKLHGLEEKYIVKRVAERRVPTEIVRREKFGWNAPGGPELLRSGSEWVADQLSYDRIQRQGYFNPEMVERVKQRYAQPGFALDIPFETDLLTIVLTFGLFLDAFDLPSLA